MTNKKEIIKTALLYIAYQIVFFLSHLLIHLVGDIYTQEILSLLFTAALFTALIYITKPTVISAASMALTQSIFYLLMRCHPGINGCFLICHISPGCGWFFYSFTDHEKAFYTMIIKLLYESIIFVLCAIVFAIIKRIKKSKSTEKPESNQE